MGKLQSSGEGTSFVDRQQSSGEASLSSDTKLDLRDLQGSTTADAPVDS